MLKIEFNHTDYREMLGFFAESLNGKLVNNVLHLPEDVGEGFIKLIELPSGLQVIVSDYIVNQDIFLHRTKTNKDFYTLRFDEVILPLNSVAEDVLQSQTESGHVETAVFLGSTKFEWMFLSKKGSRVKGVNILFSKEWIEQFLEVESVGEMIKKYLNLKMSAYNYEPMDMEYKRILAEIVHINADPSFETLIIQNRVMLLLERFFTTTFYKMSDTHFNVKLSNEDITRVKMTEKELIKDFSSEPPGINKLARCAAMSPSKLKNSFKEIYGQPIGRYYQKHRMNKAKAMLLGSKHSVREVCIEVGYSNLSNFAKAFKKAFDQLPADLLVR